MRRTGAWIVAHRGLLFVLAIAAVLRLAVFAVAVSSPHRFWSKDDREYLAIARHLHASYIARSGHYFDFGLRRPPAYPLFVRGVFDVFGEHYAAVVAVQLVLSVATVGVTYWLAGLFLPKRFALIAAGALAVDPASIVFANQMLTETLFALLVTTAIGLVVLAWRETRVLYAALAGLTLGIAVLVRPIAEYLPLVIVLGLVVAGWGRRRRTLVSVAVALLLGFALPAGAWVARNAAVTGVPIISTIDGHNMLDYRAVGALMEDGASQSSAQHYVLVRLARHVHPGDNAAEVSRAQLRLGVTILAEHPLGAVRSWARGELRLVDGPGRAEIEILLVGREAVPNIGVRAVIVVAQIITFAIVIGALIGLVGLVVRWIRLPDLWIVALVGVYLLVIAGGPEAYSRFRVPVAPCFVVLGAAALFQATRSREA